MRVISASLSLIVFSILRISIGVALATWTPDAGPGVLSLTVVPRRLVAAGSLPGVAVDLLGLTAGPEAAAAPPPIVALVFEEPRMVEPARLFERMRLTVG